MGDVIKLPVTKKPKKKKSKYVDMECTASATGSVFNTEPDAWDAAVDDDDFYYEWEAIVSEMVPESYRAFEAGLIFKRIGGAEADHQGYKAFTEAAAEFENRYRCLLPMAYEEEDAEQGVSFTDVVYWKYMACAAYYLAGRELQARQLLDDNGGEIESGPQLPELVIQHLILKDYGALNNPKFGIAKNRVEGPIDWSFGEGLELFSIALSTGDETKFKDAIVRLDHAIALSNLVSGASSHSSWLLRAINALMVDEYNTHWKKETTNA